MERIKMESSFIICIIFIILFFSVSFIGIFSTVKFAKVIIPALTVIFCGLCFYVVNGTSGSPRSFDSSFLNKTKIKSRSTVEGGFFTEQNTFLLIKDPDSSHAIFYSFTYNKDFVEKLRKAMLIHSSKFGGEQWGFTLEPSNSSNSNRHVSNEFSDNPFPNPDLVIQSNLIPQKQPVDSSGDISSYHSQ